MENPEILFYIVAGLLYFLLRGRKKKKKTISPPKPARERSEKESGHPAEEPQLSFEELLKELTGQAAKTAPDPVKEQKPVPETEYKPKPLVSETRPLPSFDDRKIKEKFKKATGDKKLKTISDIVEEQKDVLSGRFKGFRIKEEENKLAAELKAMLRDSGDVKKAVVLAEILNRRY